MRTLARPAAHLGHDRHETAMVYRHLHIPKHPGLVFALVFGGYWDSSLPFSFPGVLVTVITEFFGCPGADGGVPQNVERSGICLFDFYHEDGAGFAKRGADPGGWSALDEETKKKLRCFGVKGVFFPSTESGNLRGGEDWECDGLFVLCFSFYFESSLGAPRLIISFRGYWMNLSE